MPIVFFFLGSQDLHAILWKSKGHCRICSGPRLVRILSQMNLVHVFSRCFFSFHFNIILPPTPRCSKWSLSFMFTHQHPEHILLLTVSLMHPSSRSSFFEHLKINLARITDHDVPHYAVFSGLLLLILMPKQDCALSYVDFNYTYTYLLHGAESFLRS